MSDLSNLNNLSTPDTESANPAASPIKPSFRARLAARINRIGEALVGDEPPEFSDKYIDKDGRLTDKPSEARGR